MKVLLLVISSLVLSTVTCISRSRRNAVQLLDLIDDFCDEDNLCIDDVAEDLISYVTGIDYDDEFDTEESRITVLLEAIDSKCKKDDDCMESTLEDLALRVLDDSSIVEDIVDEDMEGTDEYTDWSDEDDMYKDQMKEVGGYSGWMGSGVSEDKELEELMEIESMSDDDSAPNVYSGSTEDEDEIEFDLFENGVSDETVINRLSKDECLDNPIACEKWVEKEEQLGHNHIGFIQYDSDGEPIAEVPKSLLFKEELRIQQGGDTPDD